MTAFISQLLNVHRWLKTLVLLAGFWAMSAGTAQAATFVCGNMNTTFTPHANLRSDGAGGGKFLVSQNPSAGITIYTGTLTATANCASDDSGYRRGIVELFMGNTPRTFAGGLIITPISTPTSTISDWNACNLDHSVNGSLSSTPGPNYSTRWDANGFVLGVSAQGSYGCVVTISLNVVVSTSGAAINTSTTNFPMTATAFNGGNYADPTPVTLGATTTACVVTPSTSTVTLPTVSQLQLKNSGDTAGAQPFSITLTGCSTLATGTYLANANWSYTPGATATTIANSATSPAGNVEIQIRDANNNPIANNATSTIATGITSGTYSANFSARYYATGQATAGNVRGVVTFNMTYQ